MSDEANTLFLQSIKRMSVIASPIAASDWLYHDPVHCQDSLRLWIVDTSDLTLLQACRMRDFVAAERALTHGVDTLERGDFGETALHWLALLPCEQSLEIVCTLLEAGMPPDRATSHQAVVSEVPHFLATLPVGTTAMQWALESDNEPILSALMEKSEQQELHLDVTALLCTAARCQSDKCLVYICRTLGQAKKNVDVFDSRGFSPLYYAILSDPVEQILRFNFAKEFGWRQGMSDPYKKRNLAVINSLLSVSSLMSVHPERRFNIVHLASTLDTPDVLGLIGEHMTPPVTEITHSPDRQATYSEERLRESPSGTISLHDYPKQAKDLSLVKLINEYDIFGSPPIKSTIARGNLANFKWLLAHGAETESVNSLSFEHAIHICAWYPGEVAIEFAEELLSRDWSCLDLPNAYGYTALHHAAFNGHKSLAEYLISRGANINAHSSGSSSIFGNATPLGAAIAARSLPLVEYLCQKLAEQHCPQYARVWLCQTQDPLEYLLRPGIFFGANDRSFDGAIDPMDFGCYDHPFSKASEQIFEYLLRKPKPLVAFQHKFKSWLRYPFTNSTNYSEPIFWAVRMSNVYAVERLIQNGDYKGDFRELLEAAYNQMQIGREHLASDEARLLMIETLRDKQAAYFEYRCEQYKPSNNALPRFFMTYLRRYDKMEQKQYRRALQWISSNRLTIRPFMLDYPMFRHCYRAEFALIWVLLIIIITSIIICMQDPKCLYSVPNGIALGAAIFLVSLFPFAVIHE